MKSQLMTVQNYRNWISPENQDAEMLQGILKDGNEKEFSPHEVSTQVNSVKNNIS